MRLNVYTVIACVRVRPSRTLVQSYFHPAYSAGFARANLSEPGCEGTWGPHAAWPASHVCFHDVFGSARAPAVHPGGGGLVFTQTDGGAHLCRLLLSAGELRTPTDAWTRESRLLCLGAADQRRVSPQIDSMWLFSGRWCGVAHISLQEWGCSTLRNAGRHVVFECESIVSLKIAAPMGR